MNTVNAVLSIALSVMVVIHAYRVYRHRLLKRAYRLAIKDRDKAKQQLWELTHDKRLRD
jgi:hypothetical protein